MTGPPAAREDAVEVKVLGRSGMVQGRMLAQYHLPEHCLTLMRHHLSSRFTMGRALSHLVTLTLCLPLTEVQQPQITQLKGTNHHGGHLTAIPGKSPPPAAPTRCQEPLVVRSALTLIRSPIKPPHGTQAAHPPPVTRPAWPFLLFPVSPNPGFLLTCLFLGQCP